MRWTTTGAAVAALLAAVSPLASGAAVARPASPAAVAAPADWGRALAEDAQAFHDVIADSHPGPVDPENPAFGPLLEKGLATALQRAQTAHSYEAWYFSLQQYAASFDDGHLTLTDYQPMGHVWRVAWPGFLTSDRDGLDTVVFNRDPAAPPVGATLVSCDGRSAEAYAAEFVGKGVGRWNLRSRRQLFSSRLFVDQANPYARRAERCVFTVEGVERTYALAWRDLPDAVRDEGFAAGRSPRFRTPIELRPFGRQGYWIGLGSFESDAKSPEGQALTALRSAVAAQADALRASNVVVFDLRGNNGGSSGWISALASALWGEEWVSQRAPRSSGVDWRASQANLDEVVTVKPRLGDDPRMIAWINEVEAGLRGARARGDALWRQGGEAKSPPPSLSATTPMRARTYVLTDYGCASACLDAVDLLKALGAVQIGQETSADSLYMEVREQPAPSGRVSVVVPMKVYRGRARGSNETAVPAHAWTGALADTPGIEAWIATLNPAVR